VTLILGHTDVAGSRISISMMAAEELGIRSTRCAPSWDTHSLGYNRVTAAAARPLQPACDCRFGAQGDYRTMQARARHLGGLKKA